jgi:hypothetical protein
MELNTKVTPDVIRNLVPISVAVNTMTEIQAQAAYVALGNGVNRADGRTVRFVHGIFGKLVSHKGVDIKQLVPYIKQIFDGALYVYSTNEQNRPGHKPHTNFKNYHNYLGKIILGGNLYYVRFTIQEVRAKPKTLRNGFIPNELHSIFVSHTLLYEKTTDTPVNSQTINRATTEPIGGPPETGHAHFHDAKLQQFLEAASFYHK